VCFVNEASKQHYEKPSRKKRAKALKRSARAETGGEKHKREGMM